MCLFLLLGGMFIPTTPCVTLTGPRETTRRVPVLVSPSNERHCIKCPQISNSIAGHKTASPLIHSDMTVTAVSRVATSGMHFHLIWGFLVTFMHFFLKRPICPQIVKFEDAINQLILLWYYWNVGFGKGLKKICVHSHEKEIYFLIFWLGPGVKCQEASLPLKKKKKCRDKLCRVDWERSAMELRGSGGTAAVP